MREHLQVSQVKALCLSSRPAQPSRNEDPCRQYPACDRPMRKGLQLLRCHSLCQTQMSSRGHAWWLLHDFTLTTLEELLYQDIRSQAYTGM